MATGLSLIHLFELSSMSPVSGLEWAGRLGLEIIDPDGWREDGVNLARPINFFHFIDLAKRSTINMSQASRPINIEACRGDLKQPELSPEAKAPPLGVKPRYLVAEERFKELQAAIDRYIEAGYQPNREWIEEMLDLHSHTKFGTAKIEILGATEENVDD